MKIFDFSSLQLNHLADSSGFNRNTMEKVLRLYSILHRLDECELGQCLALKGGTAINLFLLNLPRLSVDIDLDFDRPLPKEGMLAKRKQVDRLLRSLMAEEGYSLSDKSKYTYSLDSYVYAYVTLSGAKDLIKIEINYSNRAHILKTIRSVSTQKLGQTVFFKRLADEELIGSKINAFLVRTTPRDVFDVFTLLKNGFIQNESLIRKIAIFYACLGSPIPMDFDALLLKTKAKVENLTFSKIRGALIPVLQKTRTFDWNEMVSCVLGWMKRFFQIDQNDWLFINAYNRKTFVPGVLFEGFEIEDVRSHPMAVWKTT